MAKDVRFVISASAARAEEEIRRLQRTGGAVADRLTQDFQTLGLKSSLAIEQERVAIVNSFNRIKASGVASAQEITAAESAMQQKLRDISGDVRKVDSDVHSMGNSFIDLKTILATVGVGMLTRDIVTARAELDKMTNSLNAASGSKLVGGDDLRFVRETADTLGLSLKGAASGYAQLSAAAKGTAMEGEPTRKLFTATSMAMTVLGKSSDETSGALLAMTQMMSKGTVQAEELKGQLGERIPGAMNMAAAAMGVTTGKLQQMLENGEVLASELLPRLAAEMQRRFGSQIPEAVRATQAELNRLETSLFNLKSRAASGEAVPAIIRGLASATEGLSQHLDAAAVGITALTGAAAISGLQAMIANMGKFALVSSAGRAGLVGLAAAAGFMVGDKIAHVFDIGGIQTYEDELKRAEESEKNLAAALRKKEAAASLQKASQETNIKQVQKLTSAFQEYEKTIATVGKTEMEYARAGFTADLAKQAELMKMKGSANLSNPVASYLAVVNEAYSVQLNIERAIGQALFRIGAEQKTIAQQNVQIAQIEKTAATDRLSAWQQYYDNLKGMHSTAMESMRKQQADLFQIKMNTADLTAQVQSKLLSPMEKYYADMRQLEQKAKLAATLDSDEKIKLLQQVQQSWANLTGEVKDGDTVIVSQSTAIATALLKIKETGAQIEQEKQTQIAASAANLQTITTAMREAADQVDQHRLKVLELDRVITDLNRSFALTIDDKASPVIDKIKGALDGLRDKTITINTVYQSSYAPGASGNVSGFDSYAVGTPYVPRTGLALIHQGERIVTAADNARGNYNGNNSVTFSGNMSFTLPNVTNQSSARDLAKQVLPELEQLLRRKRAA